MLTRIKTILDLLPTALTPSQHCRNLALIGAALLIVIGLIVGWSVVFSILAALSGGFAALLTFDWLASQPVGENTLRQTSERIRNGALLFLVNLYKSISLLSLFLGLLIGVSISWVVATGFVIGVFVAELVGYLGFNMTMINRSTVLQAASRNLLAVTQLALSSAVISGLLVAGITLSVLGVFYSVLVASQTPHMATILAGLAVGAALVSVIVSISGVVFVHSVSQSGNDSTAHNDFGLALSHDTNLIMTIAEYVTERSGLITDSFATIITILIASIILNRNNAIPDQLVTYPFVIIAAAILSTIVILQVLQRMKAQVKPALLIQRVMLSSAMLTAILLFPVTLWLFDEPELVATAGISINQLYHSVLTGLLLAVLMGFASCYLDKTKSAMTHSAITSRYPSIVIYSIVIIGLYISYRQAGLIGIETSILSLVSLNSIMIAVSLSGQALHVAQTQVTEPEQLAEQQRLQSNIRAMTVVYTLTTSAVVALVLAAAFNMQFSVNETFSVINLKFLSGLIIGIAVIACFCALLIKIISRVTINARPVSTSHYAITAMVRQCRRELLVLTLMPVLAVIIVTTVFGEQLVNGFILGTGFGGLLIGFAAITGDEIWIFIKRYFEYFCSATNTPAGWDTSANEHAMTDVYRKALVSTLNPVIKMIAILSLLLAA